MKDFLQALFEGAYALQIVLLSFASDLACVVLMYRVPLWPCRPYYRLMGLLVNAIAIGGAIAPLLISIGGALADQPIVPTKYILWMVMFDIYSFLLIGSVLNQRFAFEQHPHDH